MASKYNSMTDAAFDLMSKKKRAVAFASLWQDVAKATDVAQDMIAQFYSDLTLDSRFCQLEGNKWDLRSRRKFEESHFDFSKLDMDDEEVEINEDDEPTFEEKFDEE